tara:strand:- start:454 stop:909 length:456 start_codon:yes stop_codon:yes gene_type:complete
MLKRKQKLKLKEMKKFKTLFVLMAILTASGANQVLAQSSAIINANETQILSAPIEGEGEHINPPPRSLVSLKENVKTTLTLFPNPSAGNFNLETKLRGKQKLTIIDLAGNVHLQKDIIIDETGLIKVDLSAAARGLYLVNLGQTTLKFQKI